MGNLNVMKYILFLFCILFFNFSIMADPATTGDGIQVNLNINKTDYFKPSSDFTNTMNETDRYKIGGTETLTYGGTLTPRTTYSYGSSGTTLRFGTPRCSVDTPEVCQLSTECMMKGGYWNFIDNNCGRATCHFGTTPNIEDPTKCMCSGNLDAGAFVKRGNFLQSCPSRCFNTPNQVYDFYSKMCQCVGGFRMATNGTCVAVPASATARSVPEVNECLREFVEKASACESSASTAESKCEPNSEDDSMQALRGLLLSSSGGASQNCEQAATTSTSGFYQVENNRKTCDENINSCKSGCGDAKTYLNSNKERVFNACRARAFEAQRDMGPPLPADRFNPLWDAENKPALDSQFQGLITRIDTSQATCETGTAVANREKLSNTMSDMNTAAKDANKCACQLGSSNGDCDKTAKGPADCLSDPTLPGCTRVTDNCFDPNNKSLKCVCFRNPESIACKGAPNVNVKGGVNDPSSFAGTKPGADTRGTNSETSGMAAGGGTGEQINVGNIKNLENYAQAALTQMEASGSAVTPAGNPAVGQAPAAGGGGLGGGGGASRGLSNVAAPVLDNPSVTSKLSALFESAKTTLSGAFKKGSKPSETSSGGGQYRDGGNNAVDPKKFRPRMVRGIASEDDEIAGKHEDIWKVMNKQYRAQDQKANFIFDAK